jgi:succinoglycan biosynthesis protein ExoA
MTVAVVVPCRNEAAHIVPLLDALASQTRVPDEIIIVDDHSSDATRERVEEWCQAHAEPKVRVVSGPGKGPGPAMNAGIRATAADVIMRMDGHALPAREYLQRCLDVLAAEDSRPGVVGGIWRVTPSAPTTSARAVAAVVSHPLGSGGAGYRHPYGPVRVSVETVPFGTFPRAVWEQLGGFDESLEANQDFDFNYRARQAGLDVVLDRRIVSRYFARPTLASLARQYFRYGYWKVQMLRKDPRALKARQLPPAIVLPWILATGIALAVFPGILVTGAALTYPMVVAAGGVHVGITRSVNPVAAAAAIATVHVSWSAGFWRGVLTRH